MRRLVLVTVSVLGLAALAFGAARPVLWALLQRGLDARAAVPWISADALAEGLRSDDPPVVLDVRAPEEFAVAHIPGARRVAPGADVEALAADLRDRDVVVYCSVGVRSDSLGGRLAALGVSVRNLRGAVFGWANDGRPLVDAAGAPTDVVHPYSARWGRYLKPERRAVLRAKALAATGRR